MRILARYLENRSMREAYAFLAAGKETSRRLEFILGLDENHPRLPAAQVGDERSLPGLKPFCESGWDRVMVTRYGLAGLKADGRTVLDLACGLGWGAYLLDAVAAQVVAVDFDERSLEFASRFWPGQRTGYVRANLAQPLPFADGCFDVVVAMECIEHLAPKVRGAFFRELSRVLRTGGYVWGSSFFPTAQQTKGLKVDLNPCHFQLCTREELQGFIREHFSAGRIFQNQLLFQARK